jgi:Na+(H+)/acetate symporter ActP
MAIDILRDVSVIFLAVEAFVFALIPLALFGALVYGVWWLRMHRNLPTWLSKTRGYVTLGLSYVDQAMDVLAKPVIAAHAAFATLEGWVRGLRGRRR